MGQESNATGSLVELYVEPLAGNTGIPHWVRFEQMKVPTYDHLLQEWYNFIGDHTHDIDGQALLCGALWEACRHDWIVTAE